MRKWLIASLGINLFLAGMVAAPYLGGRPPMMDPMAREGRGPMPPRGPFSFVARLMPTLPADEAGKLKVIFEEEHANAEKRRSQMRDVMKKTGVILKSEKPDMEALREALKEVRVAGDTMHEGMSRALERVAMELSAETRRQLVDALDRGHPPEMDAPR